ncbi:acyl-CoA desaturase [Aliikangiella sp. IMCC44653]
MKKRHLNVFTLLAKLKTQLIAVRAWFDTSELSQKDTETINLTRIIPFILMHLVAIVGPFYVGFSWAAFWVCVLLYLVRMFAITAFYHRYFSHKNFATSRVVQFLFACVAASAAQRGPLWWASHHRNHHRNTDLASDPHSPRQKGFLWSHTLWFLADKNFSTELSRIKDFAKYKELRWLDRFDMLIPALLAFALYLFGALLASYFPELKTNASQMLIWGFFVSTIVLYHATYTINSLAHKFGSRRFETQDDSKNNFILALITLGEGWHNNHHYYSGTVRQGFKWWEIDITFYLLKAMSSVGLVWDLKPIPPKVKLKMEALNEK